MTAIRCLSSIFSVRNSRLWAGFIILLILESSEDAVAERDRQYDPDDDRRVPEVRRLDFYKQFENLYIDRATEVRMDAHTLRAAVANSGGVPKQFPSVPF